MTLKELNARVGAYIKVFTKVKEKVLAKFLEEAVLGILLSKSICIADIARSLEARSETTSRHVFKRLDRNIGEWDVLPIKEKVQAKQIAMIDEDTFIYFDPSDAVKEYGDSFEAMGFVADGSDGHKVKRGYHINACIGMKGSEIIPLEWELYSSREEDFESQNKEYIGQIETIWHRSRCKGTFVMDREFDRFAIIRYLHELGAKFIIRMKENRSYHPIYAPPAERRKHYNRWEVIERFSVTKAKVWLDIRIKKKLVKKLFTIEAAKVELLEKIDSPKTLTLVRAITPDKLTLYLLTNMEDITPESLTNIVEAYLNRWKVDEFIRFVKQEYKSESFRVRSLGRIKNLFALLFIATVVLTRISELNITFSKTKALLIKHSKRVFRIPQKMRFFLYTLADGLSEVLKKITKTIIRLWHAPPKHQLALNFGGLL
jgi:hypothetical protein